MNRVAVAEPEPLVDLVIEEPAWAAVPGFAEAVEMGAKLALEATGRDPAQWQVALLACSDARISALNAGFRGRESATDVLSWPAFDPAPPPAPVSGAGPRTPLGDVAIALETTRKDAEARGLDLKDHVVHLILHSVLHLLGFDHVDAGDAETMEAIEVRALARIGLSDPYDFAEGRGVAEVRGAPGAYPNR